MSDTYIPLERFLRGLPTSQDEVTLTFKFIEQLINDQLPAAAHEDHNWWGNQRPGMEVESIAWMDAGWLVEMVGLKEGWVRFVRQ